MHVYDGIEILHHTLIVTSVEIPVGLLQIEAQLTSEVNITGKGASNSTSEKYFHFVMSCYLLEFSYGN